MSQTQRAIPAHEKPGHPKAFSQRSAFLLNANARAVSDRLAERMAEVVPAGDLFLSRSLEDAEVFVRTIARRGYGQVFTGGGDGTVVSTVNLLRDAVKDEGGAMPAVGVLKLGTGNAMARALGAGSPLVDAHHIVKHGAQDARPIDLVETSDGSLTPFAGMGYDGSVLNDYVWLKKKAHEYGPVTRALAESVGGYLGAMLLRSVPREIVQPAAKVRITSTSDAFLMRATKSGDEEVCIPAGTLLYEGPAPVVSIGTIPFFGFGFTMFPFAQKKPGYMQLRVCAVPILVILANLFPSVWKGSFRHEKLHDFLVKDVQIEADRPLPYQVGGDARGHRQSLSFRVHDEPVPMLALGPRLLPEQKALFGLLPMPARTK